MGRHPVVGAARSVVAHLGRRRQHLDRLIPCVRADGARLPDRSRQPPGPVLVEELADGVVEATRGCPVVKLAIVVAAGADVALHLPQPVELVGEVHLAGQRERRHGRPDHALLVGERVHRRVDEATLRHHVCHDPIDVAVDGPARHLVEHGLERLVVEHAAVDHPARLVAQGRDRPHAGALRPRSGGARRGRRAEKGRLKRDRERGRCSRRPREPVGGLVACELVAPAQVAPERAQDPVLQLAERRVRRVGIRRRLPPQRGRGRVEHHRPRRFGLTGQRGRERVDRLGGQPLDVRHLPLGPGDPAEHVVDRDREHLAVQHRRPLALLLILVLGEALDRGHVEPRPAQVGKLRPSGDRRGQSRPVQAPRARAGDDIDGDAHAQGLDELRPQVEHGVWPVVAHGRPAGPPQPVDLGGHAAHPHGQRHAPVHHERQASLAGWGRARGHRRATLRPRPRGVKTAQVPAARPRCVSASIVTAASRTAAVTMYLVAAA